MVAEPAGELPEIQNRRNEIEIGANLCLSYRFAPALYRYGLSTVYAPKITRKLRQKGETISERTVGKYMKEMGIKAQ